MAVSGPGTGTVGGSVFSQINITPLTDIFLVLLIIFMVTTSVTIESAPMSICRRPTTLRPKTRA